MFSKTNVKVVAVCSSSTLQAGFNCGELNSGAFTSLIFTLMQSSKHRKVVTGTDKEFHLFVQTLEEKAAYKVCVLTQ